MVGSLAMQLELAAMSQGNKRLIITEFEAIQGELEIAINRKSTF